MCHDAFSIVIIKYSNVYVHKESVKKEGTLGYPFFNLHDGRKSFEIDF